MVLRGGGLAGRWGWRRRGPAFGWCRSVPVSLRVPDVVAGVSDGELGIPRIAVRLSLRGVEREREPRVEGLCACAERPGAIWTAETWRR